MKEYEELHIAMLNTYDILVEDATVEDIMVTTDNFMIFDPTEGINEKVCDTLISYFEDLEEYEKCSKILKYRATYVTNKYS